MTATPDDRRYLETHEWHRLDGDLVVVGVSAFAVDELSDVTYVEFLETSGRIEAGQTFGEIESVKATSDLYCGISGEIVEVNVQVQEDPAILNQDPFDQGWLIKVRPDDPQHLQGLKSAAEYDADHA